MCRRACLKGFKAQPPQACTAKDPHFCISCSRGCAGCDATPYASSVSSCSKVCSCPAACSQHSPPGPCGLPPVCGGKGHFAAPSSFLLAQHTSARQQCTITEPNRCCCCSKRCCAITHRMPAWSAWPCRAAREYLVGCRRAGRMHRVHPLLRCMHALCHPRSPVVLTPVSFHNQLAT